MWIQALMTILVLFFSPLCWGELDWQTRDGWDEAFTQFAEWDGEFEKHCGNSPCQCLSPSQRNFEALREAVNHEAEWEWVTNKIREHIPQIQANQREFHSFAYDLLHPEEASSQEHFEKSERYFNDFQLLLAYTDQHRNLKKQLHKSCEVHFKGNIKLNTGQCKKLKDQIQILESGMALVYEQSPLLAMEPMQTWLGLELKRSNGAERSDSNNVRGFEQRLAQAAKQAADISGDKGREYLEILEVTSREKQHKILYSEKLLVELGPGSDFGRPTPEGRRDKSVLCRLSSRIYKEKAAGVLKGFVKNVGLVVLPGTSIKLARWLAGAKTLSKTTLVGVGLTAESAGVLDAWNDIEKQERKCEQLKNSFYTWQETSSLLDRDQGRVQLQDVKDCEKGLYLQKQMLVIAAVGGTVSGVSDGLSASKLAVSSRGHPAKTLERLSAVGQKLRSTLDEITLAGVFRAKSQPFKKQYATFDGISSKDNQRYMDMMSDEAIMKGKVSMEFELSFLKSLNDTTLRDKGFATALGNFGKSRFTEHLRKNLGSKYDEMMKYSDYKSIRVALDDSPEVRAALSKAYADTLNDVDELFKQYPEAAELMRRRGTQASGSVRKQFNAGLGKGVRGPDRAMKMARHSRSLPESQAGQLRDFDEFSSTFNQQAINIELRRRSVQKTLLGTRQGSKALRKVGDGVYVLNADAIQILRKSSLSRRMRNTPEAAREADDEYFGKIRIGFQQQFGVNLSRDQVQEIVALHHSLDEFSPGFFSVKRTDMSLDQMTADSKRKTFITFDREKAGATNEEEIAAALAGKPDISAETAIVHARLGVEKADEVLSHWRTTVRETGFHSLSREGKIRLFGGEEVFAKLTKIEQQRYLQGTYLDDFVRISADDAFLAGRGVLNSEDLEAIHRGLAQSDIGGLTRTTVGQVRPARASEWLGALSGGRIGKSPAQLAQAAGEYREAVSKKMVEEFYRHVRPGRGKKPYFEVRADYSRPWERTQVYVYGPVSSEDRRSLLQAYFRAVPTLMRGGLKFVEP